MKYRRVLAALGILAMLAGAGAVRADEHLRFPGDVPVDIYHSGGPSGMTASG